MLFGKRKKLPPPGSDPAVASKSGHQQLYRVDYDMMLKGSTYKRRSGEVRQFGVTVDGATRLVTSGDVVDKATYDALVAVGAIRDTRTKPQQPPNGGKAQQVKTDSPDLPPRRSKNGEREQAI